jgi:hypothetical protein
MAPRAMIVDAAQQLVFLVEYSFTKHNKPGRSIGGGYLAVKIVSRHVIASVPGKKLSTFLDSCSFLRIGQVVNFFFCITSVSNHF